MGFSSLLFPSSYSSFILPVSSGTDIYLQSLSRLFLHHRQLHHPVSHHPKLIPFSQPAFHLHALHSRGLPQYNPTLFLVDNASSPTLAFNIRPSSLDISSFITRSRIPLRPHIKNDNSRSFASSPNTSNIVKHTFSLSSTLAFNIPLQLMRFLPRHRIFCLFLSLSFADHTPPFVLASTIFFSLVFYF